MPIWKHRRGKSIFLRAGKMLTLTWCQYGSTEGREKIFLCAGKILATTWCQYGSMERGKENFSMRRKDVNSDLMPIWKPIWKKGTIIFICQGGGKFFSVPERCQGWILRLRRPVATSWRQPLGTIGTSWCVRTLHYHNNNIKHNKKRLRNTHMHTNTWTARKIRTSWCVRTLCAQQPLINTNINTHQPFAQSWCFRTMWAHKIITHK